MSKLTTLTLRNTKLFFKDKGMFFTSLITPLILLLLYATFLAKTYKDSFLAGLGDFAGVPEELIDATVAGQLLSSLLAVCCITVAFSCNLLMVQDKITGARRDLTMAPVKSSTMALGYYLSTMLATMLVCLIAAGACLIYVAAVGWYMSLSDALYLLLDVVLLVLFGTALSGCINLFLTSQGQISAVSAIVSAGYGFICGAYIPMSQFGETLQKVLAFLPGTYGTALLRTHAMNGCFEEMARLGVPEGVIDTIKNSVDCNISFFDRQVSVLAMYGIVAGGALLCLLLYIVLHFLRQRAKKSR